MLSKRSRRAFDSWKSFNDALGELTLPELYEMLEHEKMTLRRSSYITRLITRVVSLKSQEIKDDLTSRFL